MNNTHSLFRKKFLSAFALLLLAASSMATAEDVKFGIYGALSGGTGPLGQSMKNGVELAVEEINAAGGILGKKIAIVFRDDEAKNEKGAQVVQELLDKEGVVALFGPTNTGVADASTRYTNKRKVPQFISVSAGAKVNELFKDSPENYVFRIVANDDIQSKVIVKEAVVARKFKKPAILCDDTNFGQAGRERLEKELATKKITPVYVGKFKIKDTDMSAQLLQAKAAGADVILGYGIGPEMAAVSNSMDRIGWKVPLIGAWTLSMPNYINNAGKNGEGTSMPQSFIEAGKHTPREEKFLSAYRAKYNEKPIQSAIAAVQAYDSVYLLKAGIEQAQSFEGAKVRAALENLSKPFQGVTGVYSKPFNGKDHEAMKESHVKVGVVKDGIVVPKAN